MQKSLLTQQGNKKEELLFESHTDGYKELLALYKFLCLIIVSLYLGFGK